MSPLYSSPKVQRDESRELDTPRDLPRGTNGVFVAVSFGRSDQRVHVRVEAWHVPDRDDTRASSSVLLDTYTIRCGVAVWRALLLPALRQHCALARYAFEVREVQNGPAVVSTAPSSSPSPRYPS